MRRLLPILAVLAGCGGGGPAPAGPLVRDSAGIAVVENESLDGDPAWSGVRAVPDLDTGLRADASPDAQLGQVVALAVDAAGRMYALDQQARVVRVFAADGALAGSVGGPGEGPGEFSRYVNGVLVRGDTVLVTDWATRRITRFAADGTLLGTEEIRPSGVRTSWQAAPDGTLRARALRIQTDSTGRWVSDDVLLSVRAGDGSVDTLFALDYRKTDVGGPGRVKAPLIVNSPAWAVRADGGIAWTALDRAEVRIHDADGRLVRIIRHAAWVPRQATESDRAHLIDLLRTRLRELGGDPAAIAGLDIPPIGTLPVLTSVRPGPRATLWVQRAGEPSTYRAFAINDAEFTHGLGGPLWDVFDADGRFLVTVPLPRDTQILQLRDDAVYGIRRDSLGVESIVRLRLENLPR